MPWAAAQSRDDGFMLNGGGIKGYLEYEGF